MYRDLKPENILIDRNGYAKITDFGLSKENIVDNSSTHSFCGTPEYLAPEILHRTGHGKAVDYWSLGALIYEMITGLPPFYTRDRDRLFHNIKYTNLNMPKFLSPEVTDLLQKLFIKDPNQRLGSGLEGVNEIKNHLWFAKLNWQAMEQQLIQPPFVPRMQEEEDVRFFEPVFVKMPAVDSVNSDAFSGCSPTYDGFSY